MREIIVFEGLDDLLVNRTMKIVCHIMWSLYIWLWFPTGVPPRRTRVPYRLFWVTAKYWIVFFSAS